MALPTSFSLTHTSSHIVELSRSTYAFNHFSRPHILPHRELNPNNGIRSPAYCPLYYEGLNIQVPLTHPRLQIIKALVITIIYTRYTGNNVELICKLIMAPSQYFIIQCICFMQSPYLQATKLVILILLDRSSS